MKLLRAVALLMAFSLSSFVACASVSELTGSETSHSVFDPASSDPLEFDSVHPPRLVDTIFESDGAGMNAIVYEAQGPGPHPTVVLLHGFPGNERNLDLAQAIRRAGWNVVFFHYRGAWGSGGQFSFLHVVEDVVVVVDAIAAPEFASEHRIDPDRIALVGHSMGGFSALIAGAELPRVDCIVSIAGANLGGMARGMENDPERAAGFAAALDGWAGPIKGPSGAVLIEELVEHAGEFDTIAQADALAKRRLLLVAGSRDVVTPVAFHHEPLVTALKAAQAESIEAVIFDDADHSFSGQRIALARLVTAWLQTECNEGD